MWKPEVEPPGAGVTSSFEPPAVSTEGHPGAPEEQNMLISSASKRASFKKTSDRQLEKK